MIANYKEKWGFSMCAEAIDGIHIPVTTLQQNHESYNNRKSHHSIVIVRNTDYIHLVYDLKTNRDRIKFVKLVLIDNLKTQQQPSFVSQCFQAHLTGDGGSSMTHGHHSEQLYLKQRNPVTNSFDADTEPHEKDDASA